MTITSGKRTNVLLSSSPRFVEHPNSVMSAQCSGNVSLMHSRCVKSMECGLAPHVEGGELCSPGSMPGRL